MPGPVPNRAQMREIIRHAIGQAPTPFDVATGPPGAQPPNFTYPTNEQLNDCLAQSVAWWNATCGFHVQNFDPIALPAQAASFRGAYQVQMQPMTWAGHAPQQVNNVQQAYILDANQSLYPLTFTSMETMNSWGGTWQISPAGVPTNLWIIGYEIYLWPAPTMACTLYILGGDGLVSFLNDDSTIDQAPADYQPAFTEFAIWQWSLQDSANSDSQMRAQAYGIKVNGMRDPSGKIAVDGWVQKLKRWQYGINAQAQPNIGIVTNRRVPQNWHNTR